MATITPIAYNTGSPVSGTTQFGDLAVGDTAQDYGAFPGGLRFWATPDQNIGYVIAKPTPSGNQPNPLSIPSSVGFYRSNALTDNSFTTLVNNVFSQSFSTGIQAKTWLEGNGYWTSFANNLILELNATNPASYPGSGSTWYDLSGTGNNGTLTNVAYTGSLSGSMLFNGANAYVSIGQPISTSGSFTIGAWVYANNVSLSHNIVSSQNSPFWINVGTLSAGIGGSYTLVNSTSFPTNQWKFVAVTFDDALNTMKLYVNGALVDTNSSVTETYTAENTFIGSHYNGVSNVSFWDGQIPQVYIYNKAQSGADVLNLYNNTKSTYGL